MCDINSKAFLQLNVSNKHFSAKECNAVIFHANAEGKSNVNIT